MKTSDTTKTFLFANGGEENFPVRVAGDADAPLFVAVDVCKILGLSQPSRALAALDEDEKMTLTLSKSHPGKRGGAQFQSFVTESGLYHLVFKSRKEAAKSFRKWVTGEVLPEIRRSGSFPGGSPVEKAMPTVPEFLAECGLDIARDSAVIVSFSDAVRRAEYVLRLEKKTVCAESGLRRMPRAVYELAAAELCRSSRMRLAGGDAA